MSRRKRSRAAAIEAKRYASASAPVKACPHCADPETGECLYPYYGQALPGPNFRPDPDAPGLGTFTHCPQCGAGADSED